ncbi:MAG: four helix bundle protein [Deltaproteobacteria bacterium]|nr:four helix bundle protein [Deltaproteobacteria bacterium]
MENAFKFERLEVWSLSLDYIDLCYALAEQLPKQEKYNLNDQLVRAATSIALNIAEGSTSQSDPEQARFLGLALRSFIETVACRRLVERTHHGRALQDLLSSSEELGQKLFAKLQAMRHALVNQDETRLAVHRPRSAVIARR